MTQSKKSPEENEKFPHLNNFWKHNRAIIVKKQVYYCRLVIDNFVARTL